MLTLLFYISVVGAAAMLIILICDISNGKKKERKMIDKAVENNKKIPVRKEKKTADDWSKAEKTDAVIGDAPGGDPTEAITADAASDNSAALPGTFPKNGDIPGMNTAESSYDAGIDKTEGIYDDKTEGIAGNAAGNREDDLTEGLAGETAANPGIDLTEGLDGEATEGLAAEATEGLDAEATEGLDAEATEGLDADRQTEQMGNGSAGGIKPSFCSQCGNRVSGKFCSRCGHRIY